MGSLVPRDERLVNAWLAGFNLARNPDSLRELRRKDEEVESFKLIWF